MSPCVPVVEQSRKPAGGGVASADVRYAALVDQMVDGFFVADAAGRYVEVNRAGCEMLGYSREELLGMSIAEVVDVTEIPRILPEVGRLSGGDVVRSEWRFRRRNGSLFVGEVVGRQLPDGRLQAILRDVTARERVRERLARLSNAYQMRSEINKCVARAEDERELLSNVARIAIQHGGFRHVRVVPLEVEAPVPLPDVRCEIAGHALGDMEPAAKPGEAALREGLRRVLAGRERHGPSSCAADPILASVCGSCGDPCVGTAFPLVKDDRRVGAMVFYAKDEDAFDEDTLRLLEEIAADVSFGLGSLAEARRVHESELRFVTLFRASPGSILIVRMPDDRIVDVNDAFLRTFGYERGEVVDHRISEGLLWPDEDSRRAVADLLERNGRVRDIEAVWRHRSGEARDCLVSGEIVVLGGIRHMACIVSDVTERRAIDRLLYAREQEFRALAENSPDIISRFDRQGRRVYANRELSRCFGVTLAQVLGRTPTEGMPGSEAARLVEDTVAHVLATAEEAELDISANEGAKGRMVHRHVRIVPEFETTGEVRSVLAIARDITRLKEAKQRLREMQEQLRELDARREHDREDERKRIAREIHDVLGQMLTALRLEIDMLGMDFGADRPALLERTAKAMGLVDETVAVVRSLASALRPAVLDLGIVSALEWLAREFSARSNVPCELDAREGDVELDEQSATEAFRIAQESLTNVARHARAGNVDIVLSRTAEGYELSVRDDGVGFDPANVGKHALGLVGMRERAAGLGGDLMVESAPGAGTRVVARWPRREEAP